MNNEIKAAVLGCTGYTGLELVNILIKHPNVTLSFLGSQSHSGDFINKHDKRFKNVSLPQLESLENINFSKFDVVFFASSEVTWDRSIICQGCHWSCNQRWWIDEKWVNKLEISRTPEIEV